MNLEQAKQRIAQLEAEKVALVEWLANVKNDAFKTAQNRDDANMKDNYLYKGTAFREVLDFIETN